MFDRLCWFALRGYSDILIICDCFLQFNKKEAKLSMLEDNKDIFVCKYKSGGDLLSMNLLNSLGIE